MKNLRITFLFISILFSSYQQEMIADDLHEACLETRDYIGCMRSYSQKKSPIKKVPLSKDIHIWHNFRGDRINELGEECGPTLCIAKKGRDMHDMPKIVDWLYTESPEYNLVDYISPTYKVKVRGEYGRYIHVKRVKRVYLSPKAGTSGYSSGGGNLSTNCSSFRGDINCTTYTSPTYNVPGSPSRPGGVRQVNIDFVIDCKDRTYQRIIDNKSTKWKDVDLISKALADGRCNEYISFYPESSITKYSKGKKK
tara:strand:- start:113 stop:871 length:759 start_codon:yes stop_codon:yes gene_type:complete